MANGKKRFCEKLMELLESMRPDDGLEEEDDRFWHYVFSHLKECRECYEAFFLTGVFPGADCPDDALEISLTLAKGEVTSLSDEQLRHIIECAYCLATAGRYEQEMRKGGDVEITDAAKAEFFLKRGDARAAKGDLDGAIADYTKAIELKPDYAEAYNNRGIAWVDKGEYDKAIEDFSRAVELKPDLAQAYYNRGNAWANKGEYDRAIEDYTKAIELKPDYAAAYNNRGFARAEMGDLNGAIADYTKAVELNPQDARAYNNRGNAKYYKGDLDGAIEDLTKAIKLKPDYARAYLKRGDAFYRKGDIENAIKDYSRARELFETEGETPWVARAYYNLAIATAEKGDRQRAIQYLEEARRRFSAVGDEKGLLLAQKAERSLAGNLICSIPFELGKPPLGVAAGANRRVLHRMIKIPVAELNTKMYMWVIARGEEVLIEFEKVPEAINTIVIHRKDDETPVIEIRRSGSRTSAPLSEEQLEVIRNLSEKGELTVSLYR